MSEPLWQDAVSPGMHPLPWLPVELLCELPAGDFPAGISKLPGQWIDQQKMAEGIASARWPGRFEVLEDVPPLIIDGAHNPDGVKSLIDSIALYLRDWPGDFGYGSFCR